MSEEAAKSDEQEKVELDIKSTHTFKTWKHEASLIGCRYDPSGRYVFASAMDYTVQRWDLVEDKHVSLGGHDSWLRAIGFSPDGKQTFTAGYDGKLCFWETDSESPQPTREIDAHDGWVRWLSVSPDGKLLATGANDLLVKLWSTESGELVHTLEGHKKHVYSTLFHPGGEYLLTGDLKGVVNQWEVKSGKLMRTLDASGLHMYHGGQQVDFGGVRCMALSQDLKELACGGLHKGSNPFGAVQEPLVLVFDWESGKQIRSHEAKDIKKGIIWRLIYQSDGTLVGASGGGSGGFVLFWRTDKTEVHQFKLPNTVFDMDIHPNRLDLVTVHHDSHVRISRMAAKA